MIINNRQKEIQEQIEKGKHLIPDYMWGGVERYMVHGIPAGGFLMAVFENDLMEACGHADSTNQHNLFNYAIFLYNHAPSNSFGPKEQVENWIKTNQEERKASEGSE